MKQTIVETVEAPRLEGLSVAGFAKFKEDRDVYERCIAEKNLNPNLSVQLTTYKDSIDPCLLDIFAPGNWVPVDDVKDIKESHPKECVEKHCVVTPKNYDLGILDETLKDLKLARADQENTLEDRVWQLILEYKKILKGCGYHLFTEKHPKIAVGHLISRIGHHQLMNRMLIMCKLKKEDEFQKTFKVFVRTLAKEAKLLDRMNAAKKYRASQSDHDEIGILRPSSGK